ncbi:TolC family protein [Parvibium lacunae]|uniref:TolC family protein n=1 Tax=Parvibium lacunae TaxID=1888893 RepID=A0A368L1Z7_9BURK|nr:TolC family protein [Parvibium lacunae]RCS57471.1 TolC family protein [Parvibium lacunae]
MTFSPSLSLSLIPQAIFTVSALTLPLHGHAQLAAASNTEVGMFATGPTYTLPTLLDLAKQHNLGLQAAQAQQRAVVAGETTARAIPNPELDWNQRRYRSSQSTGSGYGQGIALVQPLENPAFRAARIDTAIARTEFGKQQYRQIELNLVTEVKTVFYDMLRRQEEVRAAREDTQLVAQIRERIRVRTETGEGARFDLVRADAELAVARNQLTSAELRLQQARSRMLQLLGKTALPPGQSASAQAVSQPSSLYAFGVNGEWDKPLTPAQLAAMEAELLSRNPDLSAAQAAVTVAQRRLETERNSVLPQVGVRLGQEREPEVRQTQVGVVLAVPLFDRRRGPIAEASADAERARLAAEQREYELTEAFRAARQTYVTSFQQLQALEQGVVNNAKRAVEIAEAAYRYGERGILEYLDAQRTFRAVRNELIAARNNVQQAKIELERLVGLEVNRP